MTSSVRDAAVEAAIAENTKIYLDGLAERAEALSPPPASELVTVAWRWRDDWQGASEVWHYNERKYDLDDAIFEELVTREQAEAREADLLRRGRT